MFAQNFILDTENGVKYVLIVVRNITSCNRLL